MKKLLLLLFVMIFAVNLTYGVKATKPKNSKKDTKTKFGISDTIIGYKIIDDKIIFMYNPKDYPKGFDEVEIVTVSGPFNGWDADAKDWRMVLNEKDGIWYFETTKNIVKSGMQFQFVVNGIDWQDPDYSKVPEENVTEGGWCGMAPQLTIIY